MAIRSIGCISDHFGPLNDFSAFPLQCLFRMLGPLQPFLNSFNRFLAFFKDQKTIWWKNCQAGNICVWIFHTSMPMETWLPLWVQHYHLCCTFSSSRSLCFASKMFLIIFSHFKDQKTPLMMTIFSLKIFFLNFFVWICPWQIGHHLYQHNMSYLE